MAPPVKDRQQLPDIAKPTADLIERLGFKWELDYEYPLPDVSRRVQIRNTSHYAPPAQVAHYAAGMRRGDKFPPIVVTKDGHLIDGNTRVTAAAKNKRPDLPAFILNVDYESATDSVRNRLHLLGAGFNTRNGKGIDRTEIANAVKAVAGSGDYDATRVAALLGVTDATIQGIFAEQRARERAAKLGIHLNGTVPSSQVKLLGQRSQKLNDEPFTEITKLAADAGLGRTELGDLCNRVQAAGSDEEKLDIITEERRSRDEQIAEYVATGKKKPPVSGELRRKLGYIFTYEEDPGSLVEHNKDVAGKHLEQLGKAIRILQAAQAQQREMMKAG
jgi:ParB-like chromosome segregation protein Spo0J